MSLYNVVCFHFLLQHVMKTRGFFHKSLNLHVRWFSPSTEWFKSFWSRKTAHKSIYCAELCYFFKYKHTYTFASGAFFVSSVTCTEIGSALFCTGCVGSTDVRVISTFQYVLWAADALPSSVTDTGAITFVTCPSVGEVTFALTGTVQAISCTRALWKVLVQTKLFFNDPFLEINLCICTWKELITNVLVHLHFLK